MRFASKYPLIRFAVKHSLASLCFGGLLTSTAIAQTDQPATSTNRSKISATAANADCWEIHSLGTLGGTWSYARGLNNSGQVIGDAQTEPRIYDSADPPLAQGRPFISAPNGGALTEITTEGKFWGEATGVNDAARVVGNTTEGSSAPATFLTAPGGSIGVTSFGYAAVYDINNVDDSIFDFATPHSSIRSGATGEFTTITIPDWPSPGNPALHAVALNDSAQVAVNSPVYGYRWSATEGSINLTPGATSSSVTGINNAGQVIGTVVNSGQSQAFVTYRNSTTLYMLGAPGDGNVPTGINAIGQIVGTKTISGAKHGYVTPPWNIQRTINLDALKEVTRDAWSELEPVAINDSGQIAGTGTINGEDRAFLLTPKWTSSLPHFFRCLVESTR